MASNKTFTYVGSSIRQGTFKVRYANDAMRVKTLINSGHLEVNLFELPRPMTKAEIAAEGFLDKIVPKKEDNKMADIKARAAAKRAQKAADAADTAAVLAAVTSTETA